MRQTTFACQPSFEKYVPVSRGEQFLNTMEAVVPWTELEALIEPHHPKAGKGRHPVALGTMLRIYFLQHWSNLSDPGAGNALCESPVLRGVAGVDLGRMAVPDETTILNFRHLVEIHDLCGAIFDTANQFLDRNGIRISTGTIVDATIIAAPSSTRNSKKERHAEMHQTGRETNTTAEPRRTSAWIARKALCVRSAHRRSRCMTSMRCLTYSMARKKVWGDGGYQGQTEAIHTAGPDAQDMTNR